MAETKIEWADFTFSPWRGCTKVSAACHNCYAETLSKRNPSVLGTWGPSGTRVVAAESYWRQPLKWNKRAVQEGRRYRVFCASLADVFEDWTGEITTNRGMIAGCCSTCGNFSDFDCGHRDSPLRRDLTLDDVRRRLFELIDATPHLDWLLLTKRPQNIWSMWPEYEYHACLTGDCPHERASDCDQNTKYRANVWLGTTVESQAMADKRIPELLKCRDLSPVLFLSGEPLLGPVHLEPHLTREYEPTEDYVAFDGIDWIIAGGESGPHARPSHPDWFRSLRDQCQAAGVPFHFKQWGEFAPCDQIGGGVPVSSMNKHAIVYPDGAWNRDKNETLELPKALVFREGKSKTGRLLDGVEWNEFPTP